MQSPAHRVTRSGTGDRVAQSAVHPAWSVEQSGLVAIVGPAAELDVVHRWFPAGGVGNDVVVLEEAAFAAPSSVVSDEGAAALVSRRDRPLYFGGDIARVLRLASALAGPFRRRALLAFQIGDQEREGAIDDFGQISAGDRVPEQ